MKRLTPIFTGLLLLGITFQVRSQEKTNALSPAISLGRSVNLHSAILKEDYTILVSTPSGYDNENNKSRYPVIYILDGEYYFGFTREAAGILSQVNGNGVSRIPPMIVVGVISNNRMRDFTPVAEKNWQPPQPPDLEGKSMATGGADIFLDHLEREIIPYVDKGYRTEPYRILIGHSLGGLLAFHAMVRRPNLFQAHIIGDPSLWWNEGATGKAFINHLKTHSDYKGGLVLLRPEVPREYWFPINIELSNFLHSSSPKGLTFKFVELENERHETVIFPGVYFGLRELYAGYGYEFHEKANIHEVKKHYDSLSRLYNYRIVLPERLYYALREQSLVRQNNIKLAMVTCEEWLKEYPDSPLAHEMTGRTFMESGDRKKALPYLERALFLKPDNSEVKVLIDELRSN
jgi:predicted alpha/beta superfamily hydrolase